MASNLLKPLWTSQAVKYALRIRPVNPRILSNLISAPTPLLRITHYPIRKFHGSSLLSTQDNFDDLIAKVSQYSPDGLVDLDVTYASRPFKETQKPIRDLLADKRYVNRNNTIVFHRATPDGHVICHAVRRADQPKSSEAASEAEAEAGTQAETGTEGGKSKLLDPLDRKVLAKLKGKKKTKTKTKVKNIMIHWNISLSDLQTHKRKEFEKHLSKGNSLLIYVSSKENAARVDWNNLGENVLNPKDGRSNAQSDLELMGRQKVFSQLTGILDELGSRTEAPVGDVSGRMILKYGPKRTANSAAKEEEELEEVDDIMDGEEWDLAKRKIREAEERRMRKEEMRMLEDLRRVQNEQKMRNSRGKNNGYNKSRNSRR